MWVMLTKGMVSIVERNPAHLDEGDDKVLVIRSRRREWLAAFRDLAPDITPPAHSDGHSDYQWRSYGSREAVALGVARAVMDIRYHNFKSATDSPAHGLRNVKLRHSLTDAYHKVWNTMLAAGDGTSLYDGKWTGKSAGAGTIDICARLGHWYGNHKTCDDCGTPRPDGVHGAAGARATQREVNAWWRARGGRKGKGRKPAAKATGADCTALVMEHDAKVTTA